jgi:hypothetical protein
LARPFSHIEVGIAPVPAAMIVRAIRMLRFTIGLLVAICRRQQRAYE